jgi:hypothetical protein
MLFAAAVTQSPRPLTDAGDDDEAAAPFVHRVVPAAGLSPPATCSPASVFELASAQSLRLGVFTSGARGEQRRFYAAAREPGAVRVTGGQYPADRWTPERQEKEERRRAKQRPPKPCAAMRRMGSRLSALVGTAPRKQVSAQRAEYALALASGHEPAAAYLVAYPTAASWAPEALKARALAVSQDERVAALVLHYRTRIDAGELEAQPLHQGPRVPKAPPVQRRSAVPEVETEDYLGRL